MYIHQYTKSLCCRYPFTTYCVFTFVITWGLKYVYTSVTTGNNLPSFNFSLIAQYGPSISALFLIGITEGKEGYTRMLHSIVNWKVGAKWMFIAIAFEPIIFFSITLLHSFLYTGSLPITGTTIFIASSSLIGSFLIGLFRWGLAEEIGWRGWMFPKLQQKMSPFKASLVMAIVITMWHINPYYFSEAFSNQEGTYLLGKFPPVIERLIISVPITLVVTYIFMNTKGSLLLMMIFHSSSNASYFWLVETFGITNTIFFRTSFLIALLIITIVFSFLLINRKQKNIPKSLVNNDKLM